MFRRLAYLLPLLLLAVACSPRVQGLGPDRMVPVIEDGVFLARDGARLPLDVWQPKGKPIAVLLALHGFNMYRRYFEAMGPWLAARGITTYAYDQRGFGAAPEPGIWGGGEALRADAADAVRQVRAHHPDLPLYLMGVSMGGAVAADMLTQEDAPDIKGLILVAPALWGDDAAGSIARFGLWLAAHTVPASTATGSEMRRQPSDNIEMLRALGRDPLIIKETRIDAVYGLTLLMQRGFEAAGGLKPPKLLLFGRKDEIVPLGPVAVAYEAMPANKRLAVYPEGWHMLLRDLQAETVWRDIAAWVKDPTGALPSGAETKTLAGKASR